MKGTEAMAKRINAVLQWISKGCGAIAPTRSLTLLLTVGAVLSGILLILAARGDVAASLGRSVENEPPNAGAMQPEPGPGHRASTQQGDYPTVLQINITRFGFETREIKLKSGPFMLAVNTAVGDVSLRLDRVAGNTIRQSFLSRDKRRLRQMYDLPPGDYVLQAENNADWNCTITIEP